MSTTYREHARVQLVWAQDVTTRTVNLRQSDVDKFNAGLRFVRERTSETTS